MSDIYPGEALPDIDQADRLPPSHSDLAAKCHVYEVTLAKLFRLGGHTAIGLSDKELRGHPVVTVGGHIRGVTMVRCDESMGS